VILQEKQNSILRMQKEFEEIITDKKKKKSRLKDTIKNHLHKSRSQRIENNMFISQNKKIRASERNYWKKK
jgi:hypothetical protein